jgi:RNA polymerase-interacting CarD/CdnL/TRCF family regulator
MHKIGDKVLYGANGVMTIVDIREESALDTCRSYYVLRPTLMNTQSLTYVPTDNERLVSAMRPLLTREEIEQLIISSSEIEPLEWVKENRARADRFKKVLESGDRRAMISMIRTVEQSAVRREAEGKKNFLADEGIKLKAQKLLFSEISVVFDIPEEEIPAFIESRLK